MISVGIIDDQSLVRQGLVALLAHAPDIRITFDSAGGEEAIRLAASHQPDVILMDLRMPEFDGVALLQEFRAKALTSRVIILTTFDDDQALLQAAALGSRGFMLKDVTFESLLNGIRQVAAGGTLVRPALTTRVSQTIREMRRADDAAAKHRATVHLTDRELEVLRMLAGGFTNREIGSALNLSEGTIKNHVSAVLEKLNVRDRTRAVLRAVDEGLI
jgi:DNA-binding NarL/FixJ family response regulator